MGIMSADPILLLARVAVRSTQERETETDFTTMGRSGLQVSRICLGMMSYGHRESEGDWVLGEDAAEPLVRRAIEAGVTYFDTADMYSDGASEQVAGRLLDKFFPHREDYVLTTKVYFPRAIVKSCGCGLLIRLR